MTSFYCLLYICLFISLQPADTEDVGHRKCRCGIATNRNRSKRIVGGEKAGPHEFPWLATIFYRHAYRCGGSIINDQYILTAGHCVSGNPKQMFVVVGNAELIPGNRTNQLRVDYTLTHEHFKPTEHHHDIYDIGLIRLKNKLDFKFGMVWPICLPLRRRNLRNLRGIIVGSEWKMLRNYKVGFIKKGTVTIMSIDECRKSAITTYITGSYNQIICAKSNRDDACQGDSGGPLLLSSNPAILTGIISWGVNCGNPRYPGIYTNVRYFLKWIKQHTSDATYCKR